MDLDYDNDTNQLTRIQHGCSSCGGNRGYVWQASLTDLEYTAPEYDPNDPPTFEEWNDPNRFFSIRISHFPSISCQPEPGSGKLSI